MEPDSQCEHSGCTRPRHCKGYCSKHYQQFRKHGRTFDDPPRGGRPQHRCKTCGEVGYIYCPEHALAGFGKCKVAACPLPARSARGHFCDAHAREDRRLRHFYGIGIIEYERRREQQQGRCAICEQERPLHLDHNHVTRALRRFLCGSCNRGLGMFDDDPALLEAAAAYLRAG